jgi:hypothetical protein
VVSKPHVGQKFKARADRKNAAQTGAFAYFLAGGNAEIRFEREFSNHL